MQPATAMLCQVRFGAAPKPAREGACAPRNTSSLLVRIRWTRLAQRRISPIEIEIFLYLAR
jgi:hypothetical protein